MPYLKIQLEISDQSNDTEDYYYYVPNPWSKLDAYDIWCSREFFDSTYADRLLKLSKVHRVPKQSTVLEFPQH